MTDSNFRVKRIYDPPDPKDGERILVDGLWPRGLKREALLLDGWLKEVAPSKELRNWFRHDPDRWEDFLERYFIELRGKEAVWKPLVKSALKGNVTLLYAARDTERNNAEALKMFLEGYGMP